MGKVLSVTYIHSFPACKVPNIIEKIDDGFEQKLQFGLEPSSNPGTALPCYLVQEKQTFNLNLIFF